MPLRIRQESIAIGLLNSGIQTEKSIEINLKYKTDFGIMQYQEMIFQQTPVHFCGVSSYQAVEWNLPMDWNIHFNTAKEENKEVHISFKIPQEKTRLFGLKTLPITFTQAGEFATEKSIQMKTIHNAKLENEQKEILYKIGEEFNIPLNVQGHYHLSEKISLQKMLKVLMTTENQIEVVFEPVMNKSPQKIVFIVNEELFKTNVVSPAIAIKTQLENYYKNFQSKFFSRIEDSEEVEEEETEMQNHIITSDSLSGELIKMRKYLNKIISGNNVKNKIKFIIQTVGGAVNYNAEIKYEIICDNSVRVCETNIKLNRPILLSTENSLWTLEAKIQTIFPEFVNRIDEIDVKDKQKQTIATIVNIDWGFSPKDQKSQKIQHEQIRFNIQGMPAQNVIKDIDNYENLSETSREIYNQYTKKYKNKFTPIINEYLINVQYNISAKKHYNLEKFLEFLKNINYWNTQTKVLNNKASVLQMQSNPDEIIDRNIQLGLVFDSITREHVNISYETNLERVKIPTFSLGMKVELPCLIRPKIKYVQPFYSMKEYISDVYSSYKQFSQCKIDLKNIETFDGVVYSIPMSKCYTVLAKDCLNEDKPKFVVLLKNLKVENMPEKQKVKYFCIYIILK